MSGTLKRGKKVAKARTRTLKTGTRAIRIKLPRKACKGRAVLKLTVRDGRATS